VSAIVSNVTQIHATAVFCGVHGIGECAVHRQRSLAVDMERPLDSTNRGDGKRNLIVNPIGWSTGLLLGGGGIIISPECDDLYRVGGIGNEYELVLVIAKAHERRRHTATV
jgi:hypothetical protein